MLLLKDEVVPDFLRCSFVRSAYTGITLRLPNADYRRQAKNYPDAKGFS